MDKFQLKKQIKRLLSEEYNMGGFADGSAKSQQSTLGSNGDSTMNTPTIKENDSATPASRSNAISFLEDDDEGYALIYKWVKEGTIDVAEFKMLCNQVVPIGF